VSTRHLFRALPGLVATLLLVVATTTAASSGIASLFYEGWSRPIVHQASYLAPAIAMIALGAVALRWPLAGGALLIVASLGAGARWLMTRLALGIAPFDFLLMNAAVMVGPFVVAGLLLFAEARHRRLLREEGAKPSPHWIVRNLRYVLIVGVPLVAVAIPALQQLPALLARHDDGLRGARVVDGNGVTLEWAGAGPGWNQQEPAGGYPSWNALMKDPASGRDRCAYLNESGTALLDKPAGIWRLPAADEIVRSLSRGGTNAGCAWDGKAHHALCRTPPDKETPLWAPDQAPIYYWSAQEAGASTAFAVNYTGGISRLPKSMAAGIGYRCVRTASTSAVGR
jgi:hypothetical protein